MTSICTYKGMTKRNLKVYLKDRMAIIFSMITPIIVLGLYLLFLKDTYISSFDGVISSESADVIVNAWLIAGVVGTSVVTVALNALTVMVTDKQNKIDYDYNASPAKSSVVFMSYFTGAFINTFIISALLLTAGFIFIGVNNNFYYCATDVLSAYALVALGALSGTMVLMLFASFFKKSSTLSSFGVLISAGIGFAIGAYIPISQFDESVQNVVNIIPGSQIAALLRNVLMTSAINNADSAVKGMDTAVFADKTKEMFSLKLNVFGNQMDIPHMLIYTAVLIAVFLVLNLISYKMTSKRKS